MPHATKLLSKISVSITKLCELQFHHKFANIKHQIKKIFLKTVWAKIKESSHFFWLKKPGLFMVICEGITHWGVLTEEHLNPRYHVVGRYTGRISSTDLYVKTFVQALKSCSVRERWDEMQPPGYMVGLEAPCLGSSCAWKDEIFVSRFQRGFPVEPTGIVIQALN